MDWALEWAVQVGGGVIVPGGVKEKAECGTQCHGLVNKVVLGHRLDLMISKVLSNLNDSMILQNLTAFLFSLVWLSGYPDTIWIALPLVKI